MERADKLKLIKKIVIGILISIFALLLLLILLYFTNLDTIILSPKLNGVVRDSITLRTIENVEIYLNEVKYTSNENGEFSIPINTYSNLDFSFLKESYNTLQQEININKSFLTNSYSIEVFLIPSERGIITGKFITDIEGYNFAGDKLSINSFNYPISLDGSFKISNVSEGEVSFLFESPNFLDIEKEITIKPTDNVLEDINLVEASDIVGQFKDWVNETTTIKANIQVSEVSENLISVSNSGEFRVKDLVPEKDYEIRVTHPSYLTRDYKLTTKRGNNEILDLKMVANDFYGIYTQRVNSKLQILKSDLDGENETVLTNISSLSPQFLLLEDNLIYFQDDYENIRGLSSSLDLLYTIDISNPNYDINRITTNTSELTEIYSYPLRNVLVNFYEDRASKDRKYYIALNNLDGSNPLLVNSLEAVEYQQVLPSLNGDIVYYTVVENDSELYKLYKFTKESNSNELIFSEGNISLYDLSLDGEYLIYSKLNSITEFNDLYIYETSSRSNRLIMQNHNGFDYQFDVDNNDVVYFYSQRDGRENIYKYTYSNNSTDRVTFLDLDESFSDIYINNRYIFYVLEDRGIYVLDKYIPKNYKLVKAFD